MKILFVIRSWGIGGEQRAASLITQGLSARGHNVTLKVLGPRAVSSAVEIDASVSVSYTPGGHGRFRTVRMVQAIRQELANERVDLIVGFGTNAAIVACLALNKSRVPIVVCERTDPAVGETSRRLLRAIAYRRATAAVFQTDEASNCFGKRYFKHRTTIPNPVHPRAGIRLETRRRPVVVSHSRLTGAKNHRLLIGAFAEVAPRHPEYTLEIYGEGPLESSLRDLIGQLRLQQRIRLFDAQPDVLDKVADCELFVLSSDHEGFPNSLAEAMCLGLACISTDCRIGGPKSMISDGVNGRLVPVGDVASMAAALDDLMSDPAYRERIGWTARGLASSLDPEVVAASWTRFLEVVTVDS